MKILFISQYYYPENFRGNDIAAFLAKDNAVHVVCGTPNYPEGRFYAGYGWLRCNREIRDGVKITRLPIIPRGRNPVMLILNYFSYMFVACIYVLFHAMRHKYDLVFVQQLSPVMMSVPGVLYKKLRHVPLYTWVLDLWPESLSAAGGINNKLLLQFFSRYASKEYEWSDKLLISSNSFRKSILRYGDYADKIIYYPQWAEDVFSGSSEGMKIPTLPDGFKIMFAGNVGEAQDFDHIMEAALLCKDRKDIKWLIVGDGRKLQFVKGFIAEHKLEETVFTYGRFPIETMPSFFDKSDVMLVSLKDTPVFRLTAPAKIQAYMAARKPIIAMLSGEGAELIEEADCGYCVEAEDSAGLSSLVKTITEIPTDVLQRKGGNGYEFYQRHFIKEKCLERLKEILY